MHPNATLIWRALRVGAAACFIGHGAFGIIGKDAWLPYFALVGIGPEWAHRLMPLIGTVDVLVGLSVLFRPRPVVLLYMTVWAVWTATLRPLTGDAFAELIERAGNYGVPLALLLLSEWPADLAAWFRPARMHAGGDGSMNRAALTLLGTTALLLVGHGLLGVGGKPGLVEHYSALNVGDPATTARVVGRAEIGLTLLLLAVPHAAIAACIASWKLASESLFLVAGAPIWEVVERGGSYVAPFVLMLLARCYRLPRLSLSALAPRPVVTALVALILPLAPHIARAQHAASEVSDEQLLTRLRRGDLVLACRHAITDHSREDQNPMVMADRTTQRNLSAAGEQQARDLGAAVRAASIPIGEVYSNPLFRTRETATLAFGHTTPMDSLDGPTLKRLLARKVGDGSNRVYVTRNGMLMTAFRGVATVSFQEGDCAVVAPSDSAYQFVAKLTPAAFGRLAELARKGP